MTRIVSTREEGVANKLDAVHVLIMDSSQQVTDLFKTMLHDLGFTNVFAAHNSVQGLAMMRDAKINLIITDWALSQHNVAPQSTDASNPVQELSGIEFVKRLRYSNSVSNAVIPVIMLADAMEKLQVLAARDAGVNEICVKPLSAEKLCSRIIAVIDKPRIFITADSYRGPCRRRRAATDKPEQERRTHEIRIIKHQESIRD
jgi:CheY-like chemotaxis protein